MHEKMHEDPKPGGERDLLFPSTLSQDDPSFWHQLVGSGCNSNYQFPLVLPEPSSPHVSLEVVRIYWATPPPQRPESQLQGLLLQAPRVPAGVRHTLLRELSPRRAPIQASGFHKPKPLIHFVLPGFRGFL